MRMLNSNPTLEGTAQDLLLFGQFVQTRNGPQARNRELGPKAAFAVRCLIFGLCFQQHNFMYNEEISIEAFVWSAFVALFAAPSCLSTCWFRMIVCDI